MHKLAIASARITAQQKVIILGIRDTPRHEIGSDEKIAFASCEAGTHSCKYMEI